MPSQNLPPIIPESQFAPANPYASPGPPPQPAPPQPGTEFVFRLLREGGGLWLMPSHVGTGLQFYGQKDPQQLLGPYAAEAQQMGCHPHVYQTVLWMTVLFFPIVPLGVYRVMPALDSTWGQQFKMTRVPWDWRQVACHAAVAWVPLVLFVALSCGGLIYSSAKN